MLVLRGKRDAAAGDPAVDPEDGCLEREIVHAGEDRVAVADFIAEIRDAPRVAGGLLERDEIFHAREFRKHRRGHVVRVADRVVINHDRQPGAFPHCAEERERFVAVAFVEHPGQEHEAVGPELLHVARVADGLGGACLGDAAQNGDAAIHRGDHRGHDAPLFLREHRLIFAERAEKNDAGDAAGKEDFSMACRRIEIDRPVAFHLRGDGGEDAAPVGVHRRGGKRERGVE